MEETISLQEIFETIKKRIKLIISVTLIALIISSVFTFFVSNPKYEASSQILVNQSQSQGEQLNSTDVQSSRELISTYNIILTSPAILEPVIEKANFNGGTSELQSKINVEAEEESQVATVTITDVEPRVAVNLVNTLAETFEQEISGIMDVDNVSILSKAELADSSNPVSPQPVLNLAIALIIGLFGGVVIALLLEFLDKSINTEADIENELELPILGVVPLIEGEEIKSSVNQNSKQNIRSKI